MEARDRKEIGDPSLSVSGGPPRQLGRYRIVAELGRGSTSVVYLAVLGGPQGFNKLFALKQLRPALAEDPALLTMFLAEARLAASLSHPNVVSTLEIEDGESLPYIVMEYLDGQSLQQVVTAARIAFTPIPLAIHLAAISGAVEGLGYAHAAVGYDGSPLQVVHRDVSPHNVFVTSGGLAKVLDFGVAQTIDSPYAMPTSAGRASYMSPEQAAGEPVDARSDLFAIGVMLWEAATRKRFWSEGHGKAEILQSLASRRLPESRVSALASVAPDLQAVILKATAPDATDRHASATALQDDLQVVLRRMAPPDSDPRELGRRLTTLFAHERARLQTAIEAQLEVPNSATARERAARAAAPRESTSNSASPPSTLPIEVEVEPEPLISATEPDPAPAVEAAISRPMPTLVLSRKARAADWVARHQGAVVAAVAFALGGAGIFVLRAHERESAQTSRPPAPIASQNVPTVIAIVSGPAIDRPRVDVSPEVAPAESASSLPITQPDKAERRVDVESLPRVWKPRAYYPRDRAAVEAPEAREAAVSRDARLAPSEGQVTHRLENQATAGPPLRPIDSVNPYGP